ncbi:MAG: glycosyltransferase [Longimicrobiales bacterium]|nr:glycosyltransferase [Longimicrobiales bacterium]
MRERFTYMTPLLLALPWIALPVLVLLAVRFPRELPAGKPLRTPSVSIVVPARNEAINIVACLESLVASDYPDFEVIVVDDRSDDATGALARSVGQGRAERLVVMDGDELPEGWLGKPWACAQGARIADGDLLLFTDADTTHGPELLKRAVAGLHEDGAGLLTVVGCQLLGSFWERLVQPHIFMLMLIRFPDFERTAANDRWRDAIANGQFLLFTRDVYQGIGKHEAVRDEVVEDLALAQHVKRAGFALRIRSAENDLSTRMYRSLADLVAGWSKNIVTGGLQSFPRWMRPAVAPVSLLSGVTLWLLAPAVLVLAGVQWLTGADGWLGPDWNLWALCAYAASTALWVWFYRRMRVSALYGPLYPLAALVGSWIFIRSWVRGSNVEWKGRSYRLPPVSERA